MDGFHRDAYVLPMVYRGTRLPGRNVEDIVDDAVSAIQQAAWPRVVDQADALLFETGVEDWRRFGTWAQSMADAPRATGQGNSKPS